MTTPATYTMIVDNGGALTRQQAVAAEAQAQASAAAASESANAAAASATDAAASVNAAATSAAAAATSAVNAASSASVAATQAANAANTASQVAAELSNVVTKAPNTWNVPTFQNSWRNYGTPYNVAGYLKDATGFIHLHGMVQGGTAPIIFVLPVGYRPGGQSIFTTLANGAIARLDVLNDGEVQWVIGGTNAWVSLDGITFLAEA